MTKVQKQISKNKKRVVSSSLEGRQYRFQEYMQAHDVDVKIKGKEFFISPINASIDNYNKYSKEGTSLL